MKLLVKILFSIFFAIAIGVHIYYVIYNDNKPFWWHCLYFITYSSCWLMLLISKIKHRSIIYSSMAFFPFITHAYYGYLHIQKLDVMFWICLLVCIILPLGIVWIRSTIDIY